MTTEDETAARRVAALEQRIEALEQQVQEQQAALSAARGRINLSMRGQSRCPGCGCTRILHAPSVLDRSDSGRTRMALIQPSIWRNRGLGEFEVFVCTDCGLTEWYVKEPGALEEISDFTVLEGGGQDGEPPYR